MSENKIISWLLETLKQNYLLIATGSKKYKWTVLCIYECVRVYNLIESITLDGVQRIIIYDVFIFKNILF